jgi:hypothetical protein
MMSHPPSPHDDARGRSAARVIVVLLVAAMLLADTTILLLHDVSPTVAIGAVTAVCALAVRTTLALLPRVGVTTATDRDADGPA